MRAFLVCMLMVLLVFIETSEGVLASRLEMSTVCMEQAIKVTQKFIDV